MARAIRPVPKPTSGKKSKGKRGKTTKTVDQSAVNEKRRRINNTNRQRGKATEREVAKRLGGHVVPLSGAVKNSVHNLEGDVQVRDADERETIILVECKNSSIITPTGDRSFTVKKSVVEQAIDEAESAGAIGILRVHWHALKYEEDIGIIKFGPRHLEELVRLARLGKKYERMIDRGEIE